MIEAKKEGETLRGVQWQSAKYVDGVPDEVPTAIEGALPFVYESTGTETHFTNTLDPDAASREVFSFHQPKTLAGWLEAIRERPTAPTLRHRLRTLPELQPTGLWPAQFTAIRNLEDSLAANRPRALIQMATGSGKTFTAANVAYRLVKHADARRILFLVDRANLGRQTLKEFQSFSTPDDGRKFTELYNVQHLSSNRIDPVARVTISTIQRVYSILRGDPALDEELDEHSAFEIAGELLPIEYDPDLPPEFFDVVIVDECHRSIYGLWRQVLDYFDAFTVGLTATPNKQAFGFFNQNLVMEYGHEQAVVDGVNVDFDVYRIRTEITEQGSTIDAGLWTKFRDRQTRRSRWELLDDELPYTAAELDREGRRARPDPHRARDLPRPPLHRDLPRPHRGPEDADLREGRRARRGDRRDRPRRVREGERLRREDHLQGDRPQDGRPDRRLPQLAEPADRRDRGHDRHRHRREAARVRLLHAHRQEPHVLRADEGPRRARHLGHRPAGGRPRRDLEGAVRDRGRGRRHRGRALRDAAARPPADRAAGAPAPPGLVRRARARRDLGDRLAPRAAWIGV